MTQDVYSSNRPGTAPPGGHYSHGMGYGDALRLRPTWHPARRFAHGGLRFRSAGAAGAEERAGRAGSRGSGPQDLLKVTAYVVDVANWPRLNKVYAEVMGQARPARAVVPVPALHYGYLIEIDAVAVRRKGEAHEARLDRNHNRSRTPMPYACARSSQATCRPRTRCPAP